jgi:predicted O-linked N-acetylglucosamine transferase (SPINDLY family)
VRPQVGHDDYLALCAACDAMLDSVRWSGGNTSLDAIACALPVVTLPGAYMRARQSAAMLAQVGVPELVARDAADYVAIAARLASDREWRDELSARIDRGADRLFDDAAPVEAFAAALEARAG